MATWGVHLRIARKFLEKIEEKHHREFVVGSVAPDCGYGIKDSFGEFTPPPTVTHWSPSGMKRDCRYRDFYKTYLTGEKNDDYWFYLGYYVHLLTDIIWSKTMYMPTRKKYAKEYAENPEFLKVIKKDWNDIDVSYLRNLNESPAFDILKNAGEIKRYLTYYDDEQLTKQIRFIVDYYENYGEVKEREYQYATAEEISEFVDCVYDILYLKLKKQELI